MDTLRTLPGDDIRQIMWRFADRFDIQMAVQSARSIARSTVARLVADGQRNNHEWTPEKQQLLDDFDAAGLTALFMDPHQGGFIEGPKNLALALVAFELAWVDGGAATCSLASCLALAPIHEKGTPEQRDAYMSKCVPPQPGEDRKIWRGAFALTEALPYVGVDTGVVSGKLRVVEWEDGKEPILEVEKRGRFITNMDFANFVTAAVDTDDERIKTSCMVILEENDPGTFDRGAATLKMVHQLSSTRDPVLRLKIPASRIIGGYEVKDGCIVPKYSHAEIIGAVFHRTRIPVGVMTSAKLLSAVEPVIRYQRQRFRGGDIAEPGSPRYELGLQQKEDALHRLIDVWAAGEAGVSLGLAASRLADEFDPLEKQKDSFMEEQGISGPRGLLSALRKRRDDVLEYVRLLHTPEAERDAARFEELHNDTLVRYNAMDAEGNVSIPACKLWCTGEGAHMMREAVTLMGGYGITEDCPGFLFHKWTDTQLEATYEGPEAVQRRHLTATMIDPVFLATCEAWIEKLRRLACDRPGVGASVLMNGFEIWLWSLRYLQTAKSPDGRKLYHSKRQGVTFPMADALSWLLGPFYLLQDVLELEAKGGDNPVTAEGLGDLVQFYLDLFHVQAARAAGEAGRICAELVFGYREDAPGECACQNIGERPAEATCIQLKGLEEFLVLRSRVDGCMTGCRLAKDRAAQALTGVMIPEALDYPL
ncbi:MAG: acyl-CoA dehydrogenase family protein [Desulfovibrionaceae bacterium]